MCCIEVEVGHAGSSVAETASSEVDVMHTGQIRHLQHNVSVIHIYIICMCVCVCLVLYLGGGFVCGGLAGKWGGDGWLWVLSLSFFY